MVEIVPDLPYKFIQDILKEMPEKAKNISIYPLSEARGNSKYYLKIPQETNSIVERNTNKIVSSSIKDDKSPFSIEYCLLNNVSKDIIQEMFYDKCNKPTLIEKQNKVWAIDGSIHQAVFDLFDESKNNSNKNNSSKFLIYLESTQIIIHCTTSRYSHFQFSFLHQIVNHPTVVKLNKLCEKYKVELRFNFENK